MKACILLLVLALPALALAAEEEFTQAELEQVQTYQSMVERLCREEITQKVRSIPNQAVSVAQWITEIMNSGDYCGCASRHFAENVTPSVLREASSGASTEQLEAVVKRSGVECIVPLFKSSFPAFCHDLVAEVAKEKATEPPDSTAFCQCVQTEVDTMTVDSFETFVAGDAFPASMKRCGLDKLKRQD